MSTHEHSRRAHELVDAIKDGYTPDRADVDFLRSFLPELPKQKTLEEIIEHVYDAWMRTNYNEWAGNIDNPDILIEEWLVELHTQLQGLKDTPVNSPTHPEFLETEADYQNAPEGTIVACEDSPPWHKFDSTWLSTITHGHNSAKYMTGVIREVLRWGDGE